MLIALCVLLWPVRARATNAPSADEGEDTQSTQQALESGTADLLSSMDFSAWQGALDTNDIPLDIRELVERFSKGEFAIDGQGLAKAALWLLLYDVASVVPVMAGILVVSILGGILLKIREATPGHAAAAAEYACYLMAVAPLVLAFSSTMEAGRQAVQAMAGFSQALFPTMLALLAALGGSASGSVFQPAVLASTHALTEALNNVLFWVLMVCAALSVLNHLSPRLKLEGIVSLLMSAAAWCLGIAFTVFLGVLTVQGVSASAFDGVTLRAAKFAIDNFVPVVGGMFADTVDTLIGCSLIVKNAVGVGGVLTLAALCLKPCLTILATMLAFKLCAALLEPIADGRIVGALKDFVRVMTLLFVSVLSVGAMFIIMTTAMMACGNAILAVR